MASPKGPLRPHLSAPLPASRQALATSGPDPDIPTPALLAHAAAVAAEHEERRAPPAAAPDPGIILADIPRGDGTRLRVAWCEVEGRPFVRLAVWEGAWPVKGKQVSVRLAELGAVLKAIIAAAEKASGWRK